MLKYTQYIGYVLHMENKNLDINLNTLGLSLTSAHSHTKKSNWPIYRLQTNTFFSTTSDRRICH
jgi:hypothetical protein